MKFYAHTANDELGKPLPEYSGKWQPLDTHLRNVANLAKRFAAPLGMEKEAELAGLLHDLGKYAEDFNCIFGIPPFTESTTGPRGRLMLQG